MISDRETTSNDLKQKNKSVTQRKTWNLLLIETIWKMIYCTWSDYIWGQGHHPDTVDQVDAF